MSEPKYMMSMYNPERLEDMRVFVGTVEEIEKQINEAEPWPRNELWKQALREKVKQDAEHTEVHNAEDTGNC